MPSTDPSGCCRADVVAIPSGSRGHLWRTEGVPWNWCRSDRVSAPRVGVVSVQIVHLLSDGCRRSLSRCGAATGDLDRLRNCTRRTALTAADARRVLRNRTKEARGDPAETARYRYLTVCFSRCERAHPFGWPGVFRWRGPALAHSLLWRDGRCGHTSRAGRGCWSTRGHGRSLPGGVDDVLPVQAE